MLDWARLSQRDTRPLNQFIRYGLVGVSATVVDLAIFTALSQWVLPALDSNLGDDVRANRSSINKSIAFLIANVYTYFINARFVFVPGRHHRALEIAMFLGVSAVSLALQLTVLQFLIRQHGVPTIPATLVAIVLSAVINYLSRRFFVFKS